MVGKSETMWIMVAQDGFLDGWSSTEVENGIEIPFDNEIAEKWPLYKYENQQLIYQEDKILALEKQILINAIKKKIEMETQTITIRLNEISYTYELSQSNTSYLSKVYDLVNSKLIKKASFPFQNEMGDEVVVEIEASNVYELWLLVFFREEQRNKRLSKALDQVNIIQSIKELKMVRNDLGIE